MPKVFKVGAALRAAGVPVRVGAVNCAANADLCGVFQARWRDLTARVRCKERVARACAR